MSPHHYITYKKSRLKRGRKSRNKSKKFIYFLNCLNCEIRFPVIKSQLKRKFCSSKCCQIYQANMRRKAFFCKQKKISNDGYINIYLNGHVVPEHRAIFEKYLGRPLMKGEVVHHRNGNKQDNRIENLQLLTKSNHPSAIETKHSEDIKRLILENKILKKELDNLMQPSLFSISDR